MIEWDDKWETGNPALDQGHASFLLLTNLLHDAAPNYQMYSHLIKSAINLLKDYIEKNFQREEAELRAADYPGLEEHISQHVKFQVQVRSFIHDYEAGEHSAAKNLAATAENWLVNHIQSHDIHCARWISENP